jgi:hypothetical protein
MLRVNLIGEKENFLVDGKLARFKMNLPQVMCVRKEIPNYVLDFVS